MKNKNQHAELTERFGGRTPEIGHTQVVVGPGMIAVELVERWGSVAGAPDGEDSAGRSKIRLQEPEELVERAVKTAGLLWEAIKKQGWILEIDREAWIAEREAEDKARIKAAKAERAASGN